MAIALTRIHQHAKAVPSMYAVETILNTISFLGGVLAMIVKLTEDDADQEPIDHDGI